MGLHNSTTGSSRLDQRLEIHLEVSHGSPEYRLWSIWLFIMFVLLLSSVVVGLVGEWTNPMVMGPTSMKADVGACGSPVHDSIRDRPGRY